MTSGIGVLLCSKWTGKWRTHFQNRWHPLLHVTHLQLMSLQSIQFSAQNLLQMDNVDWNLEYKIATNSNSTFERTVYWSCHKICTNIKKKERNGVCLIPKPLLSIFVCPSFPLSITFLSRPYTSNESNPQYKRNYINFNLFNCKMKSMWVDVRGFGNKFFKYFKKKDTKLNTQENQASFHRIWIF